MNTSLLYIAVTSSVFLYKLPIREGGLDLSHPPLHSSHLPSTDFSANHQCLEGEVWGQGDGLPRPHATSWKGDHQCFGRGEDWGQEDGLPGPHATRVRVGRLGLGGKWHHAPMLHGFGEVKLLHRL